MTILLRHSKRVRLDSLGHLIYPKHLYAIVGKRVACKRCAERLMRAGPRKA